MLVSNILSPHEHEKQTSLFPAETNAVIHYQLQPETLMAQTMARKQGVLNNTRALCVNTGRFTGRCPKERFIVKDNFTEKKVNWGGFNTPIDEKIFYAVAP